MRAPSMERPDVRVKLRFAEAVFGGRYLTEQQMRVSEIDEQLRIDESSTLLVLKTFKLYFILLAFVTPQLRPKHLICRLKFSKCSANIPDLIFGPTGAERRNSGLPAMQWI
jgi:hypothetical protein